MDPRTRRPGGAGARCEMRMLMAWREGRRDREGSARRRHERCRCEMRDLGTSCWQLFVQATPFSHLPGRGPLSRYWIAYERAANVVLSPSDRAKLSVRGKIQRQEFITVLLAPRP